MPPLSNLDDLELEWAEFMHDRTGPRKDWSQDQKWRADNPGKLQQLITYRQGGARPDFSGSKKGSPERRMLEHLDAWHEAKGEATQPPPPFKKVAPITVTQQGGSDQRVCLFNPDGTLRPGVARLPGGEYTDESGARYASNGDGLENSGVRTKLAEGAFGLVKAKEMDNRSACECPTAGSPTDNTGSWTV